MAGFRNKIEVLLDVTADKATTTIKRFRTSIQEADGAVNKFKAGSNAAMASVRANAGAMAIGAGAALVTFGAKSVKAFQDTALAAGKFADATGVGVEAASRWREVGSDIGVNSTIIEGAFNKMNKTLGTTPEKFDDYGVAVASAADGTTDVSATFLNLVDRLNAIKDPAERARVASELLGKGWTGMAELIAQGSDGLRASLEGVSDAQVISPEEEAKAKRTREALDKLSDSIDGLMIEVGEAVSGLIPFATGLSDIAGSVDDLLSPLGGLAAAVPAANEGFLESAVPIAGWISALDGAEVTATGLTDTTEDLTAATEDDTDALKERTDAVERSRFASKLVTDAMIAEVDANYEAAKATIAAKEEEEAATVAAEAHAEARDRTAKAADRAADAAEEHADALNAEQDAADRSADAQQELAKALRAAADSTFAVNDATADYDSFLADLPKAIKEAKGNQEELNEVYAEGREKATSLADAVVENATEQYKSAGVTLDATAKLDLWNESMLESAATAEGPVRDAIMEMVGEMNDIPPETVANISAAVESGDIAEAKRLLDEASVARKVALELEVDERAAARAQARIDAIAKARKIDLIFNEPVARGRGPDGATVSAAPSAKAEEPWVKKSVGAAMSAVPGEFAAAGISHTSTPAAAPAAGGIDPLEAEDELQAAMYETGAIGLDTYRKYLQSRQSTMTEYSAAWLENWRQIKQLNEDEAAALKKAAEDKEAAAAAEIALQDKIQRHLYDSGHITLEQYKAYLVGRQEGLDQYSDDALALWSEILGLEAKAQADAVQAAQDAADAAYRAEEDKLEAHLKRIQELYDAARNKKSATEAAAEVDEAMAELSMAADVASWMGNDPKATAEDRTKASADLEAAKKKAAEALFKRADALTNAAGIADDTPEWASAVRLALLADKVNAPSLGHWIDHILSGIPSFASGGIMPGPKGKPGLAIVHGGEEIGAGGGTVINHFHLEGLVMDPPRAAQQIEKLLADNARRNGRNGHTVAWGVR